MLWLDLIVIGGGVSRKCDRWESLLAARAPIVPAMLRDDAGMIGAAMCAAAGDQP